MARKKACKVTDKLPQFAAKVQRKAEATLTKMIIVGSANAATMTPIDLSALLNSQYRRIFTSAERVRGVVGYSASYALPVHDPDVKMRFKRPTAEKEFLRKGFEEASDDLRSILVKGMRT